MVTRCCQAIGVVFGSGVGIDYDDGGDFDFVIAALQIGNRGVVNLVFFLLLHLRLVNGLES